ncbi:MAG TPA: bifunctional DNA primase/polymerase [Elusimicrobiota bacterium]|nr:bifunctional DNA primase/polymerase [Elusimicrobiota bacterium]
MTSQEAACGYLGRGWAPIPLAPKSKNPPHGFDLRNRLARQMTEPELVEAWKDCPDAGVGLVMGAPSGNLIAVDVDPRHGGDTSLKGLPLPPTFTTETGGGGWHYLYVAKETLPKKIGAFSGIDLIGQGGYVVAPPSIHPSGKAYKIAIDANVAPAPDWIVEACKAPAEVCGSIAATSEVSRLVEGTRNSELFSAACGFARGNCFYCGNRRCQSTTAGHLSKRIEALNRKACIPPLPKEEVWRIAENAYRFVKGKDRPGAAHIKTQDTTEDLKAVSLYTTSLPNGLLLT